MKRLTALLLALLLAAAFAGCGKTNDNSSAPSADLPGGTPEDEMPTEEPMDEDALNPATVSEHVTIQVEVEKESFTTDELINVSVTLENIGDSELVFVRGSGSNTVPDALQIELDGLVPMYKPAVQTMDYAIVTMEPGEILTYECPFAPYRADHEYYLLEPDSGFDFFEEGDFTIAEPGTIDGTVRLSYAAIEEDESQMLYNIPEEEEMLTVEVPFTVTIG